MTSVRLGWRGAAYLLLIAVTAVLVVAWWPKLYSVWREHLFTYGAITGLMAIAIVVQASNFVSFLGNPNTARLAVISHAWAIGALVNYLGPFQPGLAVRVALLKRLGIPVAESSVATLRQLFASLWLGLPVAAISLLWLDNAAMAIPALALIVAFALISRALPMLRRVATRVLLRKGAFNLMPHVESAITLPGVRSGLGILAQYGLSAAVFWFGYRQFGVSITIAAAVALACAVYASSLIPLLPANFGVLEGLCTAFGQINGLPVEQSLALAFLYRGANVTGALLLAALPIPKRVERR